MSLSRILVVEDEFIVSMEIKERLTVMGYQIVGSAASGERALELVQQHRPDLILMDIRLQGDMDGITAAEEIRRRFHLPVIFLTAYSEDSTLDRAKLAEPHGYILKPFDDRELKSTIEIALYKHRAEEELRRMNRLYDVLSQVNQAVVRAEAKEEFLDTICRLVVERGAIDLAWIGCLDDGTSHISPVACFGKHNDLLDKAKFNVDNLPEAQSNPVRAILKDKPFVCNDCGKESCFYPRDLTPSRFGFQACASFPLRFQGKVFGALNVCVQEPGFFREKETQLLEEVAMDISFALDKIEGDTRREKAEVALNAERTHLRTLINTIPDLVWLKDPQGIYLAGNPAFERFIGVKESDLLGKTDFDFFPRELAEFFRTHDLNAVRAGNSCVNEEWVTFADKGHCALLETIKTPMKDDKDHLVGVLGIAHDITTMRQTEELLRESEERFRLAMQGANDGLWDWDLKTEKVYYSPRWKSMLGYGENELGDDLDTWKRLVHPDDLEPAKRKIDDLLEGRTDKYKAEFRMLHKDGHYVDILSRGFLFRHSGSVAGRMLGTHVDITERKQKEKEVERLHRQNERILNAAGEGIVGLDNKGRTTFVNPAALKILGYEAEELLGRSFHDLTHHHKADGSPYPVKDCPTYSTLQDGVHVRISDEALWRKDGTDFPSAYSATPIFEDGTIDGAVVTFRDITLRKKAAEEARAYQERLHLALAASRMGVWEWDVRSDSVFWSTACLEILGIEEAEMGLESYKLESLTNAVHPEDVAHVMTAARQALKERAVYSADFRVIRHGGEVRWISNWGRAEYGEKGDPLRLIGIVQDITERKLAEEEKDRVETQLRQAQKMESLGTLAGGIAHDFNNILGIIMGYSELARADAHDPVQVRENLHEVLNGANRAKELVRQILAFSRSGEQEKRPVQVGLIVKEALNMLRASLPSTIEVKRNVVSKAAVMADPTQIHQVLMNLCTNSAHAIGSATGVLEVDLADVRLEPGSIPPHSQLTPGPYVKLTIKDTGHGIDPSVLDRIFDPFFTTKEKGVGTGLGLSVVHGIVQSHGGAITVVSTLDKGTVFHVYFPTIKGAEESPAVAEVSLPGGEERILVVDDEPVLAGVVKRMLDRLGYQVEIRTSGLEALEAFRHRLSDKPFDLVITDMTMPHLTGASLAKALRSIHPGVPIIICTGFSEEFDIEAAKARGIQGFLMKPVVLKDLADLVRKVLEERANGALKKN